MNYISQQEVEFSKFQNNERTAVEKIQSKRPQSHTVASSPRKKPVVRPETFDKYVQRQEAQLKKYSQQRQDHLHYEDRDTRQKTSNMTKSASNDMPPDEDDFIARQRKALKRYKQQQQAQSPRKQKA